MSSTSNKQGSEHGNLPQPPDRLESTWATFLRSPSGYEKEKLGLALIDAAMKTTEGKTWLLKIHPFLASTMTARDEEKIPRWLRERESEYLPFTEEVTGNAETGWHLSQQRRQTPHKKQKRKYDKVES